MKPDPASIPLLRPEPPPARVVHGVSRLSRSEQLRAAKRAQREAELVLAQLRLPAPLAAQPRFAARPPGFADALSALLDGETVETARYPQLKLLCWNRRSPLLSAADAWSLYERNWRFIGKRPRIPV